MGAIQEEFEHQFGLPDFYSTDINNSNAWWTSHSSGVWGGELGATRPMGSGLYASWILGRKIRSYSNGTTPLSSPTAKMTWASRSNSTAPAAPAPPPGPGHHGCRRRRRRRYHPPAPGPDQHHQRCPAKAPAGGPGSPATNSTTASTATSTCTGATGKVYFSFDAAWDIEEDWDYGLIQFSDDGGATWSWPQDEDGILTDQDPNDLGIVVPGSDLA